MQEADKLNAGESDYFEELEQRIMKHPAKAAFDALKVYDMSLFILDGNSHQLRQLICHLEDPSDAAQIVGVDRRRQMQWYFNDINRHFHNFLTSITTLIDHTRNMMGEDFIKQEHRQEYQSKVQSLFAADPLTHFLKDLRNYVNHYAIPDIALQIQLGDSEIRFLMIDLEHLEKRFHWSSYSKKFIEKHQPEIRILNLVDEYGIKSKTFYADLVGTFHKHLGRELDEVRSLMQESNRRIQSVISGQ